MVERFSRDKHCNSFGHRLLHLCKECGLGMVNGRVGEDKTDGKYTCHNNLGSSVVDYLITGFDDFHRVYSFAVGDLTEYSKHAPIHFSVATKRVYHIHGNDKPIKTIHWDDTKVDDFKHLLNSRIIDFDNIVCCVDHPNCDIDNVVSDFSNLLYDLSFDCYGKIKKGKKALTVKNEWFDNNCKDCKANFKKSVANYKVYPSSANREIMLQCKREYNKAKRKAKFSYINNEKQTVSRLAKNNPKQFWKHIKKQNMRCDIDVDLQTFYDHFKDISDIPNEVDIHEYAYNNLNVQELDKYITEQEVLKALTGLSRCKSGGLDDLIDEMFMDSKEILLPHIAKLFNYIFNNSVYPQNWLNGIIVPIPKKGDLTDPMNYRGITIMSVFAKIFSTILNNRLMLWSENNNVVNQCQFGFMKNKSTVDCVYILQS